MATSTYPVTVIAKKPAKQYGPFAPETQPLIDATLKKLRAGKGPRPEMAASVTDLDVVLTRAKKAAKDKPLSVQIIGHGIAGVLRLGASFMPQFMGSGSEPFFCVDTNPDSCNFMAKHRGAISELSLLGCNVGLPTYQTAPMSGRSLLYCYCDVLQCTVRAPVELISDDDFDDRGAFTGSLVSIDYSPQYGPTFATVRPASRSSPAPARAAGAKPQVLEIDRLITTVLPVRNPKPRPFRTSIEVVPVTWKKLAAATREITLHVKRGDNVYVVDRGRYLVGAKGEQYEVARPDELTAALFALFWS